MGVAGLAIAEKLSRVVILISGRGSNMQMLLKEAANGSCAINPVAVISDNADAPGLKIAKQLGVATAVLTAADYSSRQSYDCELQLLIDSFQPDILVLAGFMRILSMPFTQHYSGKCLNIHPSLLPKHKGLHTHKRALAAGDKWHGASVHFVDENLDSGVVIIQARVKIKTNDSEQSLATRVLQAEHQILPLAVDWLARGLLKYNGGNVTLLESALVEPILFEDGALQGDAACVPQLQVR